MAAFATTIPQMSAPSMRGPIMAILAFCAARSALPGASAIYRPGKALYARTGAKWHARLWRVSPRSSDATRSFKPSAGRL